MTISCQVHSPDTLPTQPPLIDPPAEVVRLINVERNRVMAPPLVASRKATVFAQRWADNMMYAWGLTHGNFSRRATLAFPGKYAAENIAVGQHTPAAVVQAWMGSGGHRINMLNPLYRECGVGISVPYWCLDLIS